VTKQHNDDCKKLLRLMGVPVIEAPSEAEAECAALCKSGKILEELNLSMDQFIDLCILCGCDYCDSIR
ncbi:Flap endonuclease, partial [Thalictrum thalictroides]